MNNPVYKCERCGGLYTIKDVYSDKEIKHVVATKSSQSNIMCDGLNNYDELGLCPDCLRSLEEWLKKPTSVQADEGLKESPLAKALREFAESVKNIKNGPVKACTDDEKS